MPQSMTVTLPADLKLEVEEFSQQEGRSTDEVIGQAIRQHLFLRRFRSLRERLAASAEDPSVLTDQDVFDQVS